MEHRCLPGSQGSPEVIPTPQNRSFVPQDTDLSEAGAHSLTGPFRRYLLAYTQCPERRHSHPASRRSDLLCESAGHLGEGTTTGPGLESDPNASSDTAQASQLREQLRASNGVVTGQRGRECFPEEVTSNLVSGLWPLGGTWVGSGSLGLRTPAGAWSPPCRACPGALVPPGAEATSAPDQDTLGD